MILWEIETFGFLLDHLGGYRHFRRRRILTPGTDDLLVPHDGTAESVGRLLERLKDLAGLLEWPVRLEPRREPVYPSFWFDAEHGEGVIALPEGRRDARSLVASLGLGLGAFVIEALRSDLPGGEDMRGSVAELCGVFLGFGIFIAGGRRNGRSGEGEMFELRQPELIYAVGMFMALLGYSVRGILRYFDRDSRALLREVERDLAGRWASELESLRQLVPTEEL